MSLIWSPLVQVNMLYGLVMGMPDAAALAAKAHAKGLPHILVFAIAYEETRRNTNPHVRGLAGEVGRFQIKPATARRRCPGIWIYTWEGNTGCFLKMFKADADAIGLLGATRRQNGRGPMAIAYSHRVLNHRRTFYFREYAQIYSRTDQGRPDRRGTQTAYRTSEEARRLQTPSPTSHQEIP